MECIVPCANVGAVSFKRDVMASYELYTYCWDYDANRCGSVSDKDILSDHVYHYDCESDELSIVA